MFAAASLGIVSQGYILESPYQDLKTAVWNRTDTYLPPMLSHAAYLGLRAVGPLFLPHLDEISTLKTIGGIPNDVPVLILAGDADRLARPFEARASSARSRRMGSWSSSLAPTTIICPSRRRSLFKRTLLEFCSEIRSVAREYHASKRGDAAGHQLVRDNQRLDGPHSDWTRIRSLSDGTPLPMIAGGPAGTQPGGHAIFEKRKSLLSRAT